MEPIQFVHAADLHLGCAFQGIYKANPDVASALKESTYRAFDRIVEHAINSKSDFVLFAGDIYNQSENNLQPQLRFRAGLERLHDANIKTCLIHGNHDPLETKDRSLKWPDSCHRFPAVPSEPHVLDRDGEELAAVCGMSYGKREVRENLAKRYRHNHPHLFTIGLLHANCGSVSEHGNYAPCTLEELRSFKFDYWALGHIHKRGILHQANPTVVYAGSPQGLNPKETGLHGCYQVQVDHSRQCHLDFVAAGGVVWHQEVVNASAWKSEDDAIAALYKCLGALEERFEGRSVIVRFTVTGRTPLHRWLKAPANVRDLMAHLQSHVSGEPFVWAESLRIETLSDIDFEERRQGLDIVGEVLRQADMVTSSPAGLEAAQHQLSSLYSHARAKKFLGAMDEEQLRLLLHRAAVLAVDHLVGEDEV